MGRVDGHAVGTGLGSLGGVFGGYIQGADAVFGGGQCHGQHAGYRAQGAVQRQLTQKGGVLRYILQLAAGREHGQQQGQIVHRAGLAHIGGGQVDRDAPVRELEAQVLDGGTHAVRTFPHGGIRQAYDGKGGQPARNVGLHGHGKAAQAVQAKALCYRIHGCTSLAFSARKRSKIGWKNLGGTVSLRQHLPVDFIIVKGRKDVNAAERRATNDDRQGILPVHPYLFRAGGAAAGPHGGVLRPDRARGRAGPAAVGAGGPGTVQYGAGSAGQFCPDDAAFALSVREQHRPGTVAGGAGGRAPALPAAAGSTAARRHPPGKRLFLWHLLILYR